MSGRAVAIIPARLASKRLPGKPLLDRTGRPLIAHVVENARCAASLQRIIVATDDARIAAAAEAAGAEAVMTRPDHPNGTSRIAEVVIRLWPHLAEQAQRRHGPDGGPEGRDAARIVVNLQGDEPELDPALIDRLVDALEHADPATTPMATIAGPFQPGEDPADPNIVKVVLDARGHALYFSRALIPHDRDGTGAAPLKHAGIKLWDITNGEEGARPLVDFNHISKFEREMEITQVRCGFAYVRRCACVCVCVRARMECERVCKCARMCVRMSM